MYYDEDIISVGLWLYMFTDLFYINHEDKKLRWTARKVSMIWMMNVCVILFLQVTISLRFYATQIIDLGRILSIYHELVQLKWVSDHDISSFCNLLKYDVPSCEVGKSLALTPHHLNADGEYVRGGFDLIMYLCISTIGAALIMSGLN